MSSIFVPVFTERLCRDRQDQGMSLNTLRSLCWEAA